jgi:hypothetical protein
MPVNAYTMHRRARDTFYMLSPDDQARVEAGIQALAKFPPGQWPGARAILLPDTPQEYFVPVDASLRLIVRGEPPEVLDIVRQEMLDAIARATAKAGEKAR